MTRAASPPAGAAPLAAVAAGLAAWSVGVPYVGSALGLALPVEPRLEVADHVVPGIAAAVPMGLLWLTLRRGATPSGALAIVATGICFLAGVWETSTHVPLLVQAQRGQVDWATAVWHSWTGPFLAILGIALFFMLTREEPAKR